MSTLKSLALATLVVVAIGCSDDTKGKPNNQVTGDGGTDATVSMGDGPAGMPDGATPDGGAPDGAVTMPDGGLTSIGLVDFVTGLVNGSTNPTATPASLDDKTVVDTMDPAAFDKLLGL
jgi:hypothetical protein